MFERNISGLQVNYYFVCKKKLWYYSNDLSMESGNENVEIGKVVDETSYNRNNNKHIMIDNAINIDFISEHNMLHEVKKSRKIEKASEWQVKYYMYYLKKRGVENLKAKIDYPLLKQSVMVDLTKTDEEELEKILSDIKIIINSDTPPLTENKKYCKSCAYYEFCYI